MCWKARESLQACWGPGARDFRPRFPLGGTRSPGELAAPSEVSLLREPPLRGPDGFYWEKLGSFNLFDIAHQGSGAYSA